MNSHFVVLTFLLSSTLVVADETSELQESITTALVSATNDPDGDVRFAAFSALKDQPRSNVIVRAFRRGLEDDHTNVRLLAWTKLVDYEGPTDEVLKRLISVIGQRDLAPTARKLLIEIGEPAASPLFESLTSGKTQEKLIAVQNAEATCRGISFETTSSRKLDHRGDRGMGQPGSAFKRSNNSEIRSAISTVTS